jgi:hypothetical protein
MTRIFVIRGIAILVELTLLTGVTYVLFLGAKLAILDLGLNPKYQKVIERVLTIIGCIAFTFFVSHLITFYPKLLP